MSDLLQARLIGPGGGGSSGGGGGTPVGALRLEHRSFVSDSGPVNILSSSSFYFLHAEANPSAYPAGFLDDQFDALGSAGINCHRVLMQVGFNGIPEPGHANSDSWGDRTVGPDTPDSAYRAMGERFRAAKRKLQPTLYGEDRRLIEEHIPSLDSRGKRADFAHRIGKILSEFKDTLTYVEAVNEGNDQGWSNDEIRSLTQILQSYGLRTAPSTPRDPSDFQNLYENLGAVVAGMHYERNVGGDGGEYEAMWKPWEYPWTHFNGTPEAASNQEPKEEKDIRRTLISAWVAWGARHCSHTFHARALLRGGGHWDAREGVPARIQDYPGWDQISQGFRTLTRLCPAGVANFNSTNGHWWDRGNPIDNVRKDLGSPNNGPFDDGRLFKSLTATGSSGALVVPYLWIRGEFRPRAQRPMTLTEIDLVTGDALRTEDLDNGEDFVIQPRFAETVFVGQLR